MVRHTLSKTLARKRSTAQKSAERLRVILEELHNTNQVPAIERAQVTRELADDHFEEELHELEVAEDVVEALVGHGLADVQQPLVVVRDAVDARGGCGAEAVQGWGQGFF